MPVDPALLYLVFSWGVVPFWLLLVFAPRAGFTTRLVHYGALPMLLAAAYGLLLFTEPSANRDSNMLSLAGVMAIFDQPQTVVAAWLHYLIFDLFIGAWEVRDAARRGVRHLFVVPCLVLTFLFGPLGLFAYLALRAVSRQGLDLRETRESTDAPTAS
ncbi:MAG: DUF4281 domain-containing protein [Deltaproteobacteria bacterium]|nr:DUF4281 domain-containing protein [Deltaproteobacteria bacterium]